MEPKDMQDLMLLYGLLTAALGIFLLLVAAGIFDRLGQIVKLLTWIGQLTVAQTSPQLLPPAAPTRESHKPLSTAR